MCALWAQGEEQDPQAVYESLYGQQERKALATSSRTDDIELAGKLLKSIPSLSDSPKLQALLCGKAYQLAIGHRSGYAVAVEAMRA
ncbi:MAG: hypothetical protein ACYS8K_08510, partial [Planctomycetota bacterium]